VAYKNAGWSAEKVIPTPAGRSPAADLEDDYDLDALIGVPSPAVSTASLQVREVDLDEYLAE
jgi:hypothetical protein